MKVLFINPQYGGIDGLIILPLDQASVVSYADKCGIDVHVCDLAFDPNNSRLTQTLETEEYDLALLTCITISYKKAIEAGNLLKKIKPDLPLGIMGEHVSFRKEETLNRHSCFDYVLSFEPEETLVELCESLNTPEALSEIEGLSFRTESGIEINPDRKAKRSLDEFPIPAKHLYAIDNYLARDFETTVVTTRGCTHFCSFCHRVRYGRKLRKWSVDRVLDEIRYNIDLGFTSIFFQDDVFCFDKDRTTEICKRIIDEKIDFRWNCNVRIDDFVPGVEEHEALIPLMKEAGCYRIFAGIESFSQEVLDLNKKRSKISEVKAFIDMWRNHGIEIHASYVIGFTGDTPELADQTIDMAIELGTEMASFNRIFPHPGTPLGDMPDKVGIDLPDPLWYEKDYWINEAVAGNTVMSPEVVYNMQQEAIARYTSAFFDR